MDIDTLGKLRVIDLKNELDKRGLSKAGTKSVLIQRLKEALIEEADDQREEENDGEPSNDPPVNDAEEDAVSWENDDAFDDSVAVKESVSIESPSNDKEVVSNEDIAEDDVSDEPLDGHGEDVDKADDNDNAEDEKQDGEKEVVDVKESALLDDGAMEDILDYGDDEGKHEDIISFQIEESEALIVEKKEEDEEPEEKDDEEKPDVEAEKTEKKDVEEKNTAADNKEGHPDIKKMIWVCGLTKQTRALDLKTCFGIHGKVISAKVVMNPNAKEEKCFGLVTMSNEREAAICIDKLNGFKLHNKDLIMSRPKKDNAVLRKMRQQQLAADKKPSSRPVGIRPRRVSGEAPADKRRTITGTTVSVNLKTEHGDRDSSSTKRRSSKSPAPPMRHSRHSPARKRRTRSPPRRRRSSRSPRRRSPSRRTSPRRHSPRRRSPKKRSRSPRRRSPRRRTPTRGSAEHRSSRRSPRRSSPRSAKRSRKSDEKRHSRERKERSSGNETELRVLREQTAKQEAAIKALMQGNISNVGQLLGEKLTEKLATDLKSALVKQLENTVKTMSANKPSSAERIEAQNASNAAKIKENIEKMKSNGQIREGIAPSVAPYKPASSLPAFNPLLVSHNKQPEPYGPSDSHRSSTGSSRSDSRDSRHHHRPHSDTHHSSSRRSDTYSNARAAGGTSSGGGGGGSSSQQSNKLNDLLKSIQGVKDMVNKPSNYQQVPTQSYGSSSGSQQQPPPQQPPYKTNPLMTPPPAQFPAQPFNSVPPMNFPPQNMPPPHPQMGWGAPPPAPFISHNTPQYRR